jgi:outer membrane protein assembly factor BamB
MRRQIALLLGIASISLLLSCRSASEDLGKANSEDLGKPNTEYQTATRISLPYSASVKEAPLLWKIEIPGLGADVTEMRYLDRDHVLVCFEFRAPMLVDVKEGRVLWSIPRARWATILPGSGTRDCSVAFALSDLVVLQIHGSKESAILAVDFLTGKEMWFTKLSGSSVRFIPAPASATLLAIGTGQSRAYITAYGIATGAVLWERKFRSTFEDAALAVPIVTPSNVWLFFEGIEKIRPDTGKTEWKQADLLLDETSPSSQLADGAIFLVDRNRRFVGLDPDQGGIRFSTALDKGLIVTNIFPLGEKIYLRGRRLEGKEKRSYEVVAVRKRDGKILWTYSDRAETVSNLVEEQGRLFLASSSVLIALDAATGRRLYTVPVTNTGGSFPVELRAYRDKVVYIGELVMGAFEPASGRKTYFHGLNPPSQTMHLDALDRHIKGLRERIAFYSKSLLSRGGGDGVSAYFSRQAEIAQNSSNHLWSESRQYYGAARENRSQISNSAYWKSMDAANRAQINSAFAKTYANLSFFFATQELTSSLMAAVARQYAMEVGRFEFARRTILRAYPAARYAEYAYRPIGEEGQAGVSVLHLPSGKEARTILSRAYESWGTRYGMWSLIDFDRGLIYQQGLSALPPEEQNLQYYVRYGNYLELIRK